MGHRPNKTLTSILSHYKSRIATLQHEVKSAQININEFMNGEALAEWGHVVEEFGKLVDSRRLWHVEYDGSRCYYHQVFFDMGIFDFVQSPFDTPVMRDSSGTHYYLYPTGLIKAQSSVDFEMIPIEDLNLEYGVVDLNTLENRPDFYGARKKGKKKEISNKSLYIKCGFVTTFLLFFVTLIILKNNTDICEILLKVSVLNDFYSTNIFGTYKVAENIQNLKIDEAFSPICNEIMPAKYLFGT